MREEEALLQEQSSLEDVASVTMKRRAAPPSGCTSHSCTPSSGLVDPPWVGADPGGQSGLDAGLPGFYLADHFN